MPMAKVAPEIKTRLMADGTWNDFRRFRENAQKEGNTPVAAMRLAIAKFCPDLAGLPSCPHKAGAKSAKELAVPQKSSVVGVGGAAKPVSPDVFAGKSCTVAEAANWLIEVLAYEPGKVRPEDAPGAKAWSLYMMCLRSPAFAEDLVSKTVIRQMPSGDPNDGGRGERYAGERLYNAAAAMMEAMSGAVGGNPEAGGG